MSNNEENKKKKFNQIPYRISVIQDMTSDKIIDSMVNFKNETFLSSTNYTSEDIRNLMPKNILILTKQLKN